MIVSPRFRFKHARENKCFGLCGSDKRGPVVARDVRVSVQNERLSEHGFSRGRGKKEKKVAHINTHLSLLFTGLCGVELTLRVVQ